MLQCGIFYKDIVSREVSWKDGEVRDVSFTNVRSYVRVDWHDLDKKNGKSNFHIWFPKQNIFSHIFARSKQAFSACSALLRAEYFHRTPAGYTADRKMRRKRNMGCYELLSASCHPSPPPPTSPLPTPRICRTACGHVIRISWRETPPPPPPTHSPCRILAISGDLGQSRGLPPFRSPKVLQLNLDSNCDYVRVFGAVIGHLEAEIDFWLFPRKWWKFRRSQKIWQRAAILTSRAGTVRERRRPYKLGGLSPQITWDPHAREVTSLERELFSQTWRKSAVGDSAKPKL